MPPRATMRGGWPASGRGGVGRDEMRLRFKKEWAQRVQVVLGRRASPVGSAERRSASAAIPPNAEWDEAFLRVESYLRAHQIESRVLLNQRTTEILTAARGLAAQHPHESPVTLAMQVAHARIGEWLVHALGSGDWADERFRARGRLALLMADVPNRCPEQFLSPEPLPAPVRDRITTATLEPGPELRLTRMPATPLEFPLGDAVQDKWVTFSKSAFFQASSAWLIVASLLGIAWFATR
jgi:hypothetical protein